MSDIEVIKDIKDKSDIKGYSIIFKGLLKKYSNDVNRNRLIKLNKIIQMNNNNQLNKNNRIILFNHLNNKTGGLKNGKSDFCILIQRWSL